MTERDIARRSDGMGTGMGSAVPVEVQALYLGDQLPFRSLLTNPSETQE